MKSCFARPLADFPAAIKIYRPNKKRRTNHDGKGAFLSALYGRGKVYAKDCTDIAGAILNGWRDFSRSVPYAGNPGGKIFFRRCGKRRANPDLPPNHGRVACRSLCGRQAFEAACAIGSIHFKHRFQKYRRQG